jgi:tripartite-type tricarboxylate transporter receptor subunit TctC
MSTRVPPSRLDSTKDFSSLVPAAFGQANAAFIQANAAYAAANAGGAGTDQFARDTANAAFIQANAAFAVANTGGGGGGGSSTYIDRSYTGDNTTTSFTVTSGVTNNSIIVTENGIVQAPNTDYYVSGSNVIFRIAPTSTINIGIRELALSGGGSGTDNVARDTANAAFLQANSAYESQNTTGSYANSAYTQANTATTNAATADSKAVTAGSYANSAYTEANTAVTNAATADSKAVTAGSYANSAYDQANSAALYANAAFIQANAAFIQANTGGGAGTDNVARDTANAAFIQANAAFAVANSGGGGGVSNNSTLSGTITPLANTSTQFNIIGITGDITIDAPAGTPTDGQKLIIRIKDAGTSVNVSWNVIYRVVGTSLPSTTVPSKTAYVGFIYNTADTDWDAVAVTLES